MAFAGFSTDDVVVNETILRVRHFRHPDRAAPVVVLLHGFPQTSFIWHAVVPALVPDYSVICPDLRGYGGSAKPPGTPDHGNYSKRTMASDIVGLMDKLEIDTFHLVGHDRGGRVAHRLALDHPARLKSLALIDIAPTLTMYSRTNMDFASSYFHWFFLIQPAPFPETLIGSHRIEVLETFLGGWGASGLDHYTPEALDEYRRAWADPAALHGACEDYRAAASIDLEHDREDELRGNRIACPLLVVWGKRGIVARLFDPIADWQEKTRPVVRGQGLDAGHFIPDEAPAALLSALLPFLRNPSS